MKILLFDDHRIFGESLSKLLEDWDEISICRYVSNETEFWNILSVDEWDIVLLDVNLRDQSKNCELPSLCAPFHNGIFRNQ